MITTPPSKNRLRAGFAACLAVFVFSVFTKADVVMAPAFRDNAVLQREKPVPVWGRADAGEAVTVTFGAQTAKTTAAADGRWLVTLVSMPACAEPAEILVKGKNTVTVRNVLVGDVWFCSGQSNMGWKVEQSQNFDKEAVAANYPQIRHFDTKLTVSTTPAADVEGEWVVCSPKTVGGFSAAAYFFGRDLHRELNVPIGLIKSAWGGTEIEPWMSPEAIDADPAGAEVKKRWAKVLADYPADKAEYEKNLADWKKRDAELKAQGKKSPKGAPRAPEGAGTRKEPSVLYNAMVTPFLPYAIRGFIWYQGEANHERYAQYRTLFPSMIRQWRGDFKQGDLPFFHVQLANWGGGKYYAFLREAQECALKLPATGQAVAIDIGESGNIHPKNKQEVGRRLALNAFAKTYGKSVEFSGPMYAAMKVESGGTVRVSFTHAKGLKASAKDGAKSGIAGFEVAGADRKFVPATARIDGETVVVSAKDVPAPVALRYAWAPDPKAPLYNGSGLPASPFRSDNWE